MNQDLVIYDDNQIQSLQKFCDYICKSQLIPKEYIGKPENAAVAILHGRDLGLSPMQSLQGIMNVNGRTTVWGDHALAIIQNHRDFESIKEWYDEKTQTAHCVIKRKGWDAVERTFSSAEGSMAGLNNKEIHKAYPRRMRQMRARSYAMRDTFADALRGIGIREDIEWKEEEREEVNITQDAEMEVVEEPMPITDKQKSMIMLRPDEKVKGALKVFGFNSIDDIKTDRFESFCEIVDSINDTTPVEPE